MCSSVLCIFYQTVVTSTHFYAVVCWGVGIKERNAKKSTSISGRQALCRGLTITLAEARTLSQLQAFIDSSSVPLHGMVAGMQSTVSTRLINPRYLQEGYRRFFLPVAVRLYNVYYTVLSLHCASVPFIYLFSVLSWLYCLTLFTTVSTVCHCLFALPVIFCFAFTHVHSRFMFPCLLGSCVDIV